VNAYELQMRGYRLTTAEIIYHLPDHPALLQSFIWQKFDLDLAEIRSSAGLSGTATLPRILEPQHRGQAALGERQAEQPLRPGPLPPFQARADAALKPH
jgi:Usg-like family